MEVSSGSRRCQADGTLFVFCPHQTLEPGDLSAEASGGADGNGCLDVAGRRRAGGVQVLHINTPVRDGD